MKGILLTFLKKHQVLIFPPDGKWTKDLLYGEWLGLLCWVLMTTTHSWPRVRLVTRHCPSTNNSFSKTETEIINPSPARLSGLSLRNCVSLLFQLETKQLDVFGLTYGFVHHVLRYYFYNLFQLNKLESLHLEVFLVTYLFHLSGQLNVDC